MRCIDSNESVPEVLECVQLKLGLDIQRKGVLLQLRIHGREISPVLIEYKCIIIFESVDPKSHRDSIQWVQVYGLLFHHPAHLANISQHDVFVPAAIGHRIIDSAYLQANQRGC
jgi:hypothetical protein